MKYDKTLLTAWVIFTLVGCSGGSGTNNDLSTISSDESSSSTTNVSEQNPTSSLDLVAPEGFNFNATQQVQLQLSISSPAGEQAYVSVFTQYDDTQQMANYDTRVVMMPLPKSNQIELNLNVPSYLEELWVEVWYTDKPDSPIKARVDIHNGILLADL